MRFLHLSFISLREERQDEYKRVGFLHLSFISLREERQDEYKIVGFLHLSFISLREERQDEYKIVGFGSRVILHDTPMFSPSTFLCKLYIDDVEK